MADEVVDEIDPSEFLSPEELAAVGEVSDEIDLSEFMSPEELAKLKADEELERQALGDVSDEIDLSEFLSPEELAAMEEAELERQAREEIEAEARAALVDEIDPREFLSPEELAALEDAELEAQAMRDLGITPDAMAKAKAGEGNEGAAAGGVSEEDIAAMRDLGMGEAEIKAYIDAQSKPKGGAGSSPTTSSSEGGVSAEDIAVMRDLGMGEAEIQAYIDAQTKPKGAPRSGSGTSGAGVSEEDIAAMRDMGMSEADIKKYVEAQNKPKGEKRRPGGPPQVNKDGTVDFRSMMKKRPGGGGGPGDKGSGDAPAFGMGMLKKRGGGPGAAGGDGKGGEGGGEGGGSFGLGMLKATGKRPTSETTRADQEAMPGGFGVSLKRAPMDDKLKARLGAGGDEGSAGDASGGSNPAGTPGSLFDWDALGLGDWKPPEDFENTYLQDLEEQKKEAAALAAGDTATSATKKAATPAKAPMASMSGPPPPPPKAPTAADLERAGTKGGAPPMNGPPPPPPPAPSNADLEARSAGKAPPAPPTAPGGGGALEALMAKRAAAQGGVPPPPPSAPPVPLASASASGGPPPPPKAPPVPLAASASGGPPPPPKAPPVPLAAASVPPPPPASAPVPLVAASVPPPPKVAPVPLTSASVPPPPPKAPVPLVTAPPPPITAPVPLAAPAPVPVVVAPAPLPPMPVYRELTEEERDAEMEREYAEMERKSLEFARQKRLKAEAEARAAAIARGEDPDKKPSDDDDEDEDDKAKAKEEEDKKKKDKEKEEEDKKGVYHASRSRDSASATTSSSSSSDADDAEDAEKDLEDSLAAWSSAQQGGKQDAGAFAPGMLALLELGEPSLNELLEQNDTLLLVRYRLEDFPDVAKVVTSSDSLYDMVDYLTVPVEAERDESEAQVQRRLRYPAMACELLASKVDRLDDPLVDDGVLVARLLDFFRAEPGSLPILLAPGVSRVLASLLEWRASALWPRLVDSSPPWLPALLSHVHVDSVHSLIASLAKAEGGESWLVSQQLPSQLLSLITRAEENSSDPLMRSQSRAVVEVVRELVTVCSADGALVTALCSEASSSLPSLACASPPLSLYAARDALDVLRALVLALGQHAERSGGSVAWPMAQLSELPSVVQTLLGGSQLDSLGEVLGSVSEHDVTDASGKSHAAFGVQRFAALQLLHTLASLKWSAVLESLIVSGGAALLAAINTVLDFEQCNMAHELIAQLFVLLLTHAPSDSLVPLVEDTHLVDKLLEAQRLWNAERKVERHPPPYLPYLHLIGHRLVASAAFHADLTAHCEGQDDWAMLKEELAKLRESQRRLELEEIAPLPAGYPPEPKSTEGQFSSGDEDAPAPKPTAAPVVPVVPAKIALQAAPVEEQVDVSGAGDLLDSVEADGTYDALMNDDLDAYLQGVVPGDVSADALLDEALTGGSEMDMPHAPDALDSLLADPLDEGTQQGATLSLDDILNGF